MPSLRGRTQNLRAGMATSIGLVCLFCFVCLAAGGCGRKGDVPATGSAAGSAAPGGTAVVALAADPDVLNPLIYSSTIAGIVIAELHDGLADMDENLSYVPRIARGWEIAPDGLSITYHLRPWCWSDGAPLAARDVVRSFELFQDERVASKRRGLYRDVAKAVAVDDSTVRYDLLRAVPNPVQATWHHIVPWHVVGELDPATVADWPINRQPLSSGEFTLESWAPNRELVLVRNPHYPGKPALLSRVVFRIVPEEATRLLMLETGEVDLADGVQPAAAARLSARGDLRLVASGGRSIYHLQWNCLNPAFADAGTRRALSLAIDRGRLISALVVGHGHPAVGPIPPALWNHHRGLAAPACDPAEARRLLAEAGWRDADGDGVLDRDGRPLRFEILTRSGDPVREQGVVILRENFAAVGAAVEVRAMESLAGQARAREGLFDAYFGLFNANLYGNPAPYVRSTATSEYNLGHYANATVDSLLDVALGLGDRTAALPVWQRLQEVLAEDPPAAFLFYPDNLVAINARLHDVRPHLLSPVNNLAEWWIAPADRRGADGGGSAER
jgi:peptide/nickel transport system substrate-binding protein